MTLGWLKNIIIHFILLLRSSLHCHRINTGQEVINYCKVIRNHGQEGLSALQLVNNWAGVYLTVWGLVLFLHPQMRHDLNWFWSSFSYSKGWELGRSLYSLGKHISKSKEAQFYVLHKLQVIIQVSVCQIHPVFLKHVRFLRGFSFQKGDSGTCQRDNSQILTLGDQNDPIRLSLKFGLSIFFYFSTMVF